MATWAVDSASPEFHPEDVYELGHNRALERQVLTEGTRVRVRFTLRCPRCGNAPQFREETIDEALEAVYEQGAQLMVRRVYV